MGPKCVIAFGILCEKNYHFISFFIYFFRSHCCCAHCHGREETHEIRMIENISVNNVNFVILLLKITHNFCWCTKITHFFSIYPVRFLQLKPAAFPFDTGKLRREKKKQRKWAEMIVMYRTMMNVVAFIVLQFFFSLLTEFYSERKNKNSTPVKIIRTL